MHTLTTTAQFPDEATARDAIARVLALKHDERTPVLGGAAHVEVDDTGHAKAGDDGQVTVVASLRAGRADSDDDLSRADLDKVEEALSGALGGGKTKGARGGGIKVQRGAADMVDEQFVDDAGQVTTRPANRVVHGETGETLTSRVRLVRAVDDETGEDIGERIALRSLHGEDGRKVTFPKGEPTDRDGRQGDVQVTVDEVSVDHTHSK